MNPTILSTISGTGVILKIFSEAKNYHKKAEMSKFV